MATTESTGVRASLTEIERRLHPKLNKTRAVEELNAMFRGGRAPEPRPEGFLRGRLLTMTVTAPLDGFVRRVAGLWMPWLGKRFDPDAGEGVNVLTADARVPMKGLWRSYEPEQVDGRLHAFPFRTRIATGAVDADVAVLKIDYDFEANPDRIIRRILDELVQIDAHLYLGKILYRVGKSHRPIGFFSLER